MGTRGPLKTPPQLQLLRNDPRQRGNSALGAALDLQLQAPAGIPELPLFMRYGGNGPRLAALAREEWERLAPHLERIRLVSPLDRAALTNYCFYWALDCYSTEKLIELGDDALVEVTPSGFKQMGVWVQIKNRASAMLKQYLAEFGLSPAARARVQPGEVQPGLPGMENPQEGGWAGMSVQPPAAA